MPTGGSRTSTLWELQSWSYVSLVPVFIVGSLPWAPWLRKKIQAWAEGDPHRAIVAAPQKGNTAVPPCQVVCEGPVPAGRARDLGFDRSMVIGYGQDDRVCAYTSLAAQLALGDDIPARTAVCVLVDKEEIGSVGASGMASMFFENTIAEIMALAGESSPLRLRRALTRSRMLSSDVSAGFDPAYASVFEAKNSAYLGRGLVFNKYTGSRGKSGSNDASAEYVALVRRIMDDAGVSFQTAELGRVDAGGGGTIAYIPAKYGMDVIDSGVPVLSMHSPWEVTSKADIYEARRGYEAFLRA